MRQRGLLCIAMLAAGAVAGSFAAGTTNAIHTPELSASEVLSAAEIVTLRFPHDWDEAPTASAPPAESPAKSTAMALASADSTPQTLPPALIYAAPAMPPFVTARGDAHNAPDRSLAYAPAEPAPARAMPGTPRQKTAALTPTAKRPAQAAPQSRFLFNDAQIASIKNRLKLSADQEPYWPAVEQALRNIAHDKAPASKQAAASINPNSAQVQQLKSAAIPLVMVLREEQKREVRMLAHVMGLGAVASQF